MDNTVLISQRQQIFGLMQTADLNPADFEWRNGRSVFGSDTISVLSHKASRYDFTFDQGRDGHHCTYRPGYSKKAQTEYPGDWESMLKCVRNWLYFLKREIEAVDPWDDLQRMDYSEKIILADEAANSIFSIDEVNHIEASLLRLKSEMTKAFGLTTQQLALLDNRISYLVDRSKKLGRIDWKNIFISTIMGFSLQLALSPDQQKVFVALIKTCFKGILLLAR